MTEVLVVFECDDPITGPEFVEALDTFREYCNHSLHELWKGVTQNEENVDLN